MHWPVPIKVLRRLVPDQLELDLYENEAYVGIVPFQMEGVRPWWWPKSWAMNFLETNLRAYVICDGQPGVYFFSLEASSRLAVWAARAGWGLPYHFATTNVKRTDDLIAYTTHRPRGGPRHTVRFRVGDPLGPSEIGSLQYFFLERYLLFVERRGKVYSGQVHHSPYPAHNATVLDVQDDLSAAAGLPAVTTPPAFAHFSPGVDVEVFPLGDRVIASTQ